MAAVHTLTFFPEFLQRDRQKMWFTTDVQRYVCETLFLFIFTIIPLCILIDVGCVFVTTAETLFTEWCWITAIIEKVLYVMIEIGPSVQRSGDELESAHKI